MIFKFQAADFSADFAADYGVDPNDRDPGDEPQIEDDDDDDYNDQMMEVQPDVVIHDDLADDDGEAEEEEEEPRQRMEHPDDNGEFKNKYKVGIICPLSDWDRVKDKKSVNLKYITVGRLDDDMIVPPSDGAMFILIDWE